MDCFIPKFKLEYDDLENIKTDCVNTVVFNLHQIKRLKYSRFQLTSNQTFKVFCVTYDFTEFHSEKYKHDCALQMLSSSVLTNSESVLESTKKKVFEMKSY